MENEQEESTIIDNSRTKRMKLIYSILDGKNQDLVLTLTEVEFDELRRIGYCFDCKGKCKGHSDVL